MEEAKMKIQETRAKLKKVIVESVKPIRAELDNLLKEEAQRLCPFKIDEVIVLENGKKGIIGDIDYHSLNYFFRRDDDFTFAGQMDDVDYVYAYELDEKEFSITWKISGLRMINNGNEIGKVPFRDISPDRYNIDIKNKTVSQKPLSDFLANTLDFMTDFSDIK